MDGLIGCTAVGYSLRSAVVHFKELFFAQICKAVGRIQSPVFLESLKQCLGLGCLSRALFFLVIYNFFDRSKNRMLECSVRRTLTAAKLNQN